MSILPLSSGAIRCSRDSTWWMASRSGYLAFNSGGAIAITEVIPLAGAMATGLSNLGAGKARPCSDSANSSTRSSRLLAPRL